MQIARIPAAVLLAVAAGARRRGRADPDVRQRRRADPLFEVRRVPSPDDVRADVAREVRRCASVGEIDSQPRVGADHAAMGRRSAARRVQERSAPDATRRSRPSSRGSTAARRRATTRTCRRCRVRRRLDDRQARRRVRDEGSRSRFRRAARSTTSTSAFPTGITEDKWLAAIEIKPEARAQVHHVIAFTRAGRHRRSPKAARSAPATSAASRRTSRA